MSIRPTDLPMSPVREGEVLRRVEAKPEARDRGRQPAYGRDEDEREDAEAALLADDADDELGEDTASAPAVIELSEEFRRDPAESDQGGEPNAAADEAGGERHLDIQA